MPTAVFAQEYAASLYRYPGLRRAWEEHWREANERVQAFGRPLPRYQFGEEVHAALADLDELNPKWTAPTYVPF